MANLIEEWDRLNPKTTINNQNRERFTITPKKVKWGTYGNYKVRDYLMNLIEVLENESIVVQIPKTNQQYFKILEKNVIESSKKMVKLL